MNITEKILKLTKHTESDLCNEAIKCLKQNGVIALPTDTVYGLATFSKNRSAISRIYEIKGRQFSKPCAICVADIPDIFKWAKVPVTTSLSLLNDLLPGPVTILLQPKPELNEFLNPHDELVGIRIPVNNFVRTICQISNQSLALTSANISNQESALQIEEFQPLWSRIDLIFDGGKLAIDDNMRLGSTVVNLSKPGVYQITRHGCAFDETIKILKSHGLVNKDLLLND